MDFSSIMSILGPILGGVAGRAMSQGDRDRANALLQQMIAQYQNQTTPDLPRQQDSSLTSYQDDPATKAAQMQALSQLQQLGQSGGMGMADMANMHRMQDQVGTQTAAAQNAVLQRMAARGGMGSGDALAAQMGNISSGAQQASQNGMDVAGMAQQRALQAIMGAGQLGGSIRDQDFGQAAQKASAQDLINRYNVGLPQQNFANQMHLNDARAGAYRTGYSGYMGQADQTAQGASNVGTGVGQAFAQGGGRRSNQDPYQQPQQPYQYQPQGYDSSGGYDYSNYYNGGGQL